MFQLHHVRNLKCVVSVPLFTVSKNPTLLTMKQICYVNFFAITNISQIILTLSDWKAYFTFQEFTKSIMNISLKNLQESCMHSSCAPGRIYSPAPAGKAGSRNDHSHAGDPDSTTSYRTQETTGAVHP